MGGHFWRFLALGSGRRWVGKGIEEWKGGSRDSLSTVEIRCIQGSLLVACRDAEGTRHSVGLESGVSRAR